jgi:hypothetical protein
MLSRRELISSIAVAPLLASDPTEVDFLEEAHLLAAESARGYRKTSICRAGWIIAPAVRDITADACLMLRQRVTRGATLLLESGLCFSSPAHVQGQLALLESHFALQVLAPVQADSYISYRWPAQKMLRNFHFLTPVICDEREVMATFQGSPVCAMKQLGRGKIIYLGSMLGPGLMADEREAHDLVGAL